MPPGLLGQGSSRHLPGGNTRKINPPFYRVRMHAHKLFSAGSRCSCRRLTRPIQKVCRGVLLAGDGGGSTRTRYARILRDLNLAICSLRCHPLSPCPDACSRHSCPRPQAMIGGGGLSALVAAGGGKSLYAGVWGNLAGVAPSSAIFMAFYDPIKKAVQVSLHQHQFTG